MAGFFDYLYWRGDLSLESSPFNEVDAAMLARLSYLPFERIIPSDGSEFKELPITEAYEKIAAIPGVENMLLQSEDLHFLKELSASGRFGDSVLIDGETLADKEVETQFSAITLRIGKNDLAVSFRGTDSTIVGWKEDLNMGFLCPVPAQESAAKYLKRTAARFDGKITVTGHSKGGNLAVFSSAFCGADAQKRIKNIFNCDGPGFDERVLKTDGYQSVAQRITTLVPQSSVVGMLLNHEEKYTIVHSNKTGLTQHDIYSWEVGRDSFLHLDTVTSSSRFVDKTLKDWMGEMTPAQRESFTDAIFTVIDGADVSTLHELGDNWFQSTKGMLKSIKGLDEPTRKAVTHTLMLLAKSTGSGLFRMLRQTGQTD